MIILTKMMKKCKTSHEKKYLSRKENENQVMADEVAVILLDSSYSFLALAISARKKGLEGVARWIIRMITTTKTLIISGRLSQVGRGKGDGLSPYSCSSSHLLRGHTYVRLKCFIVAFVILIVIILWFIISRKGKGGERQLADLAGPNPSSSSQVKSTQPSVKVLLVKGKKTSIGETKVSKKSNLLRSLENE